ncbi:MAG: PIN domain-containing protein [Anaerolineae bacterium]|nr:MAG: PIN domain-containing protein [Anaerolineae bacterium]
MEIAVDASVLIAVILDETEKPALIELTRGGDLIAPASVPWEVGNAFSAMFKKHRIALPQALHGLEIFHQIPLRLVDIDLAEAVELAAELNIYAYDAYLLRCAAKYRVPLLTLDNKLARLASQLGLDVLEVQ